MSKKETRRAARQAFPKAPVKPDRSKTYGQRQRPSTRASSQSSRPSRPSRPSGPARRELKPPSLKRAAIQGAILVALYLIIIRFFWKQPGTTVFAYVILGVGGFIVYTAVAYGIDKFTYQRRVRKPNGSAK
jgi:hypothetical protein